MITDNIYRQIFIRIFRIEKWKKKLNAYAAPKAINYFMFYDEQVGFDYIIIYSHFRMYISEYAHVFISTRRRDALYLVPLLWLFIAWVANITATHATLKPLSELQF